MNGQLTVLEFSKPSVTPFKQLYFLYFKYVLPFIGRITSRDSKAYKYLFESSQVFPAGTEFVKILEKAGFSSTIYKSLTLGICALYSGRK
jgi:demethylmenaquinone methyltransferase/2-methoxy-6-polyprenyl-1,4-benzoquinol methylase